MAQDAAAQALGAYIHHYAADTNRGANAVGDAFSNAVAAVPGIIGSNVGGFVNGLVNGQGPAPAAKVAAPAAAKAAPAAAPAPAADPMSAFLANQIQRQSQPGYGQTPPPTPLDVVRAAAMNNGGLSLSQLGALSESVARTVPQQMKAVPQTSKEQAAAQYLSLANDFAIKSAQDPNYAKSQAGAAHQQLMLDLRGIAATPNQINDVATGMPPLQSS